MRRHEKEVTDSNALEYILKHAQICHLAINDEDIPYIVPVNFGYEDNALYIHSATEGKKIDLLNANPHVSFCIVSQAEIQPAPKACGYTTIFSSVTGQGKVTFLSSMDEKKYGLSVIMKHHNGPHDDFPDDVMQRTAVIRISITSMIGKASKEALPA
ncbi:pyridoxamine 5'-phosphate oxidase family protein [Desulfovibrio inopinatus]|uniref:pyridoxamine 5'-phosphate oxidase family protein n=1 Tax=Desulfovibrio inopinatus TaxID=102109 RepID=UPI000408787C|nr:pyridoxamine 5'-phosphate oxidase family protein [Desulfovibrio inopinatus]